MSLSKDNNQSDKIFYNASDEAFDVTTESNFANMDPEQKAALEEEWRTELARTEEEIQTLRQVLSSKLRHSSELKKKLGISVWKEFRDDIGQGVKSIQESTASGFGILAAPTSAYQKTTETVKTVGERTTSVLGSLGGSMARKLGEVKNSNAFKSFEERVVSATGNLKDRMTGSRSNSTNSFEDALNSERRNSQTATPATTPTIPEEKSLS
ncbi:tumor protein D52-like isoform X1 [Panonychus citri]|uniref:tumor protein D52-like isoform X1 n=1 Tax=Panonychus citri TaxID=50023 RepID=UPI002306FE76|nr:tumor protein D52-like isoform X1 [Panonychus citri]